MNKDKTRVEKEMGIDVTLCLSPTAEELLTNISMHLENIAFSLKVLRDIVPEECPHCGSTDVEGTPFVESQESIERKIIADQEGPEVFDEASDDAYDPTMEPCPNCGEVKVHEFHDPDRKPINGFECEACHHVWTEDE